MKFGAHVSIAQGIDKSPQRAHEIGCGCFQIFTRPPQGGSLSNLDLKTVERFLEKCSEYNLPDYYIHTPYIINLASGDNRISESSVSLVLEELKRGSVIQAQYVVTHIGSSGKGNRDEGIKRAIEGLKKIVDKNHYFPNLLIENSAGQGATLGSSLEELAEIIEGVGDPSLGICLDTAHLFTAGYDIRTEEGVKKTLADFSLTIGLDKLKLLHGNDSKTGLGERKDRHEHIGKGKIGINGFGAIVNDPLLKDIDIIIETPIENVGDDIKNLERLKGVKSKS